MVRRDAVGHQLGLGFGKGRRVIKTVICGDALQAALARQRDWCQRHGVEDAAPASIDTGSKLRMAKADLRPKTHDDDETVRSTTADGRGGLETPGAPRVAPRARPSSSYALPLDPLASYTP